MNAKLVATIAGTAVDLGPASIELIRAIAGLIHVPRPAAGTATIDSVNAQIDMAIGTADKIVETAKAELGEDGA